MPIFEYQGKKYNVADNYINDFVKDYPEATTIVERAKKKYRIKSADYTSFLNEFPEDDKQQTPQPQQAPQSLSQTTQANVANEPSNVSQMTDAEKSETNKEYQEREQQAQAKAQTQEQPTNDTAKADVPKPTFFDDKLNTPWITDVYTSEGTPMTEKDKKVMQGEMANAMVQNRVGNMAFNDKIGNIKDYGANPFIGTKEESVVNPETGKIEKVYLTPFGNKYTNKITADNETRMLQQTPNATIDYRLFKLEQKLNALKREQSRRTKEVGEEAQQQAQKYGFVGKLIAGDLERNLQMVDREKSALQVAIRQTEEAIKDLKEQKDRDQGKDVGFWRGFGRAAGDVRTWDFGLSDVNDAMTLVQFQGMDKKNMTEDEVKAYDEMMGALYEKQLIEQQYGENADFWNRAGVMAGQMPAFMLDFALTGGGFGGIELMSKAGVKAATKAVGKEVIEDIAKQGFKNYVKANGIKGFGKAATNWTIKALGTTADDLLIRAPLMTNTIQFGKTTADIIDRKLGDVVVDKDGNYDFSNDKTLGSAIWQGEANAIIENYSEMFGAHLEPIMTLKNASKLANVIGAKRLSAVLSKADAGALNGIMGNTQKLFEKMGVSDYVGEVTEEYYGQLWRTMLNLDDAYQQNEDGSRANLLMTGQFHGDIWGGMALSMGLMGAGKHTMSGIQYASLKHNINKADNRAREIIGADDWANIKELFDLTTNDAVGAFAETIIADNTLNDEQKVAALQYMELSLNMRGLNLATLAQERNGEQNTDAQEANESYLSGYNAKNATEMNDVKNALEVQQGKISGIVDEETLVYINDNPMAFINEMRSNNLYSREEQNAIMDYVNAKLTYDGMLQGVRDGIDGEIDQSNAIIDSRVNKTSGMIQSATLKVGDRKVYVILGNVVPYQDGTGIDIAQSDKSIIIRDAETGKLEQIAPFDIHSVDEAQDPEEQRTIAADAIREKLSQEASDKIDGTITLNQGDKYTIPDAQGNLYEITITPNEQGIIDNGDGTVNVWDGEKLLPIPIQDLQSLVDKANFLRAEEADAQRQAENQSLEEQTTAQTEETKTPTNEMLLPQYEMGKSITIRDDNGNILRGSVEEVDEDGVLLAIENPETGYWNTISYNVDDLNSRLVEYDGVEYNTQTETSLNDEVEKPQVEAPVETTTEDVIDKQPGTEQGVSALERIPKDEQGNPIYEMAENADVAWDAIVEQTEGDEAIAQTVADSMLADKKAELKKAENAKSKGGATIAEKIASEKARQAAIDKAQSEVDFWEQVVGTTKRRKAEAEAEQKRLAEEARKAEEEARLAEEARKAEEERLKAEQRELDENGRPFVVAPNGTTTFGEITEDTGLISAPIKLSEGYQDEDGKGYGLVHIEANQGEQIRKAGFASVEGFVSFVAKNYDKDNIRVGKRRDNTETTTYLIQVTDEHNNNLFIELSRDGSYWNVNSGGIFRKGYSNKKETVVETEPQQPNNANSTSSSLSAEDISGISTTEPNGEPTVSTGKGTTKNETDKEVEGELTKTKLQQAKDIMDEYIKTNGKSNMDDINVLKKELTDDELNSLLDYLQNKKKYSIQAVMFKAIISHELGKRRNAENTKEGVEEKIAEAEKEVDTNPTEAQKQAGNYKKGHVKIDSYDVTIENPKGSVRSGTDASGKEWSITMNNTYGYIRGTEGVDGDHIDVFFSDNPSQGDVFVIDQVNKDGSFDEHKVMYGFSSEEEARQAYLSNYEEGWQGLGAITHVTKEEFKKWVESSHRKTKPFAYYKSVKEITEEVEQQVESSYIEKQWSENDDVEEMKQRLEYLSKATEIGSKEEKEIFPEYEQFEADKKALLEKYNGRVPKEKQDELAIKYKDFLDRRVKLFNEIYSLRIAIEEAEEKTSIKAKEQAKQEKLNNIQNSYNGYLKGLSNLVASRLDKALSKKVNISGEVKTIAEFIEEWQKNGNLNVSTRNYKPQINRRIWNRMSGQEQSAWEASHDKLKTAYLVNDYELGKTAYDYANWLLSNKSTQQVQEDKTETKPAIDPNIESLVDKVNKEYEDYYNGVGDFNTYYESKEKLVNILKKLSKEETETIINNLREKGKYTETIKSILRDVNQELKHKNKLKEYFAQAKRLTTGAKEKAKNVAFKLLDYSAKDKQIPSLTGVYHDPDGYAVSTDAHILVALKEKVDKKTSGKIIDKNGDVIEGVFPKWQKLLRTDGTNVPVNFEALRDFCAGALKECKDAGLSKKDIENKIVFVRFKNGEVMLFFLTQLNKFANAATHIEAKNVNVLNYNDSIIAQSNKGYVLLMPTLQVDESGNLNLDSGYYAYDEQGEKETKQEKKDTKQELKPETKKEVKNKEVTTEPAEKIEDVGEKIGGARKDIVVEFKQRAQEALEKAKDDLEEWIRETPVSKIFNFDLQKLRESGMSNEVISFIKICKQVIPAKPKLNRRLQSWASKTMKVYQMCLQAGTKWNEIKSLIEGSYRNAEFAKMYQAYMAVGGFDSGLELNKATLEQLGEGTYGYKNGERYSLEGKWYVSHAGSYDGIYETKEKAIEALRKYAGENAVPKGKKIEFVVYQRRKDGTCFITPKGKSDIIIQDGFKTSKEATDYRKEHGAELEERYRTLMTDTNVEFAENRKRKGRDYRGGKNVSAQEFMDAFGFRGVEFGNWTNQNDRQNSINETYDALMDLADVLGVSPKALSLNGTLGMAFGARGRGKFNAHYEPDKVVINLTKTRGHGALAHEWFHALDNYFASMVGIKGYATDRNTLIPTNTWIYNRGEQFTYKDERGKELSGEELIKRFEDYGVRKEMAEAWVNLMDKVHQSDYYKRSNKYAILHNSEYWVEPTEIGARAFSKWVENELSKRNATNDYLANNPALFAEELDEIVKEYKPYPFDTDATWMEEAFGNLFSTMEQKTDDNTGKVMLYHKADGTTEVLSDAETALRDALIGTLEGAGIEVITDNEEAQRVLDEANTDDMRQQKVSDVRFFRTTDGHAYGFTYKGKVYIDTNSATAETPIHEYSHLWASAFRKNNPQEWTNIVELMKGTPEWEEVKKKYPELTTDDEIADEVLAHYSGRRGAERLREEQQKVLDSNADVFEKASAVSAIARVKEALRRFWKGIAEWFNIHFTSAEDVADKVLADMLNGLNPNTAEIDAIIAKAKEDGIYMKAPNGKQSNLSPRQWVQVRTKAFKDWFGDWENDPDNSSKVVDENGEPLVVYHGSGDTITKFVPQERGERYWFSSNREVAESYTPFYNDVVFEEYKREYVDVKYKDGHTERQYYDLGGVHHTYLNVRNPLEIDCNGENWDNIKFEGKIVSTEYLSNYAFENGYDGTIFRNVIDGAFFGIAPSDVYVTFKSSQIKSATDNNGNFDPNNDDIRYQFVGERGAAAMDKAEEASVRLDNLAIAREMEKSGKDAKSVKLATGWERGADGKWRYEVGDGVFDRMGELHPERRRLSNSEQKELDDAFEETMQAFERGSLSYKGEITEYTDMADIYEAGGMERKKAERIRDLEDRERVLRDNPKRLDDYLDNDELFAAYPELRIILVNTSREGEEIFGKMGSYDPWNNTLYLNDTSHSTLVHEVQHAIQRIEGFERGGSPETVRQKIKDLINENKDASDYAKSRLRLYAETKSNEFFLEGPYNSIIKSDNPAVRRYAIEKYWDAMNFIDNAKDSSLVNEYPDLSPDEIALSGYHVKEAVEELKRLAKSYKEDISEDNMNALNLVQKLERLLQEKNNKELYAALGGEVESRNVEKRLGMTMDERRESLARETEDVSREDQIFLQDGMGVNMSEDGDIRYSKDIDTNRGYTQRENGTYISNRASYAEEQGRFTKGTFAKNYGVSTKAFEALEKLGVISSSEWHHTGKNFNKSNFYSWQDDGTMVDGKYISYENGEALEGSVADKYAKNKKEIDKLAKEFENKEWEYKTPKPHLYSIPSFDNYANEQVPYSAYKLTDEEENRRESEHNLISKRGREDEWYLPRERRYDHLAVDERYKEIENKRKARWIEEHRAELEQSYNNKNADKIDANNKVDAENATIDEYNQQTNGKEKVLERIANILGVSPDLKAISIKEQTEIAYNRKMEQERMLDQQVRDEMSKRKEELNKWVDAQIKKGNITTFERVSKSDIPQNSAITKTEMNGKYGWFDATTRYNLPEYYSGYSFKNKSWLDKYNDKKKSANDFYAIRAELEPQYTNADNTESDEVRYRIREEEAPKKTGIGYKVFVLKDGQLYPPMVANPNGEATPVGVWLDADAAPIAGQSKTGRSQVKSGGKGTQGGSGKLAYRPGWHLGEIPYALQFNRQDENGERTLFPKNFVWAEVEYANDVDYQEEAMSYGYNQNGKFQHSLAGLPRVPENGAYTYRTNPNPETDPWIITGAMKVNRLLTPTEVDEMVKAAGREPQRRQEGAVTDAEIEALNEEINNANRITLRKQMAERVKELAERLNLSNVEIVTNTSQLSGKQKIAKGFFNPKTGKITIVIPNNASIADVEQTLLHEAVAHYGLRQLFGTEFNTFLDNVFNNASEEVRRKIVALAAKNGWDFRTATEEYLASLAETTNFEEAQKEGWWQKVKQFFSDMLEQLGFVGFKGNAITDNELRYILWRSYENLKNGGAKNNIFNEASDIAKQYELKTGEYANTDNEMMYREGDPERHYQQLARDRYEGRMRNKWYQSKEAFQDSMLSLKEAMQAILGREVRMEDIAGFENAYLGENRLSSVNKAEADAFAHTLFKPMLDEVAKLAPTQAERQVLTEYMMAKHGLERNELMARRDAQKQVREEFGDEFDKVEKASLDDPLDEERLTTLESIKARMKDREEELYFEYRKKDYAGLTALTETENVTDAESTAKFMVDNYEASNDTTELWKRINAVNKATMSKLYECGIIDKATFDNISSMYKFYIPLRGFDEKTSADAYAYLTHSKSAFNAPYKRAKGRKSKADDPFAYMQSMAESAIAQGNRNKLVKQRFLNFILNHPSDLASVTTIWLQYNEVEKEWQPVFPNNININDTAEEVEQKMKDFEDKMTELAEQEPKRYKNGKQAVNVPYRVVEKRDLREHQIIVKRNGVDYIITINGNPRVAQAINGQTNPDNDTNGAIGAILKFGETLNRHLSAFYTTRNPDFVISNFIRDMLYSNSMVWVKETPNYALRFHSNIGRANPIQLKILLAKYRKGTLDENKPIERQFKQFMLNGGETGYSNMRDIEKHKTDIQRELAKSNGKLSVRRVFELLAERLDELNRAVENCARFAAFLTSREMGRSIDRAIYDAKEISVNFNKKGSGAKFLGAQGETKWGNVASLASGLGRSGFVFWNAAIQGMVNFGRQVKRNPNKAIPGLASLFILGALAAYLGILGSFGDDDDDKNSYYNLPEYVRRSNILFSVGDYWISLPLPIEYRSVYGMGELTISTLSGKEHKTGGEIASEIVGQATQLLPIDFLEGGGGLNAFVPSAVKPVWEAYVIEKGWTGMPIYKDNDFNKNMPEWTKAYKSANKYIVGLSEVMNEVSGGDKYTKGAIDFNPAKVEYLLNGYFGGVFSTVDKLVKSGETFVGAREFDPKSFLLMNRVVKTGDERTEYRAINNEYFRLKEEYEKTKERLRNYERDTDNDVFDYAEKIDFIYNSPEYARYEIFELYQPDIDALLEEMKDPALTDAEIKEIQAELNEVKKEMIAEMNETRKRK